MYTHCFNFLHLGNLTENSSTVKGIKEIPLENKPSKRVLTIVWISLAAILIPLLLAGLIHHLRTCNVRSKKALLNDPSPCELDKESVNDSTDPNCSVTLEKVVVQGEYFAVFKNHSKKKLYELHEGSTYHPNTEEGCMTGEHVTLEKELFQGKYSNVWKGRFRKQNVAVKIFPVTAISSFQKERYIYNALTDDHPNISKMTSLYEGETAHSGNSPLWLMMDFCENGSLRDYLKSKVSNKSKKVGLFFILVLTDRLCTN